MDHLVKINSERGLAKEDSEITATLDRHNRILIVQDAMDFDICSTLKSFNLEFSVYVFDFFNLSLIPNLRKLGVLILKPPVPSDKIKRLITPLDDAKIQESVIKFRQERDLAIEEGLVAKSEIFKREILHLLGELLERRRREEPPQSPLMIGREKGEEAEIVKGEIGGGTLIEEDEMSEDEEDGALWESVSESSMDTEDLVDYLEDHLDQD